VQKWLMFPALACVVPLTACSASIRRPVQTTDAATGLEQVTRSSQNEFDPAISPDGKSLAYEVASTSDAMPHVEVMSLADVQGTGLQRATYSSKDTLGFEPTWMPDGTGLIFVSRTKNSAKALMQTMGKSPAQTNFIVEAGDPYLVAEWPAMSPDGQTMAMSLVNVVEFRSGWRDARRFDHALGVSDLLGTGVTVLGAGSSPAFSPDGKRIAFSRNSGGHAHVFVANADGTGTAQITEGLADDVEPAWSPDGRFIVFCSAHGDDDHYVQANIFAVHDDGSGLVQLTEGDRLASRPAWGKDGFVYFHVNITDRFHIWRLRPQGTLVGG
jgi:Tol biopolymer transport system component